MSNNPTTINLTQETARDVILDALLNENPEPGTLNAEALRHVRELADSITELLIDATGEDDAPPSLAQPAWPDQVVVRVEVILPDRLQPDRTKQRNGARVLLAPEAVAPGLAGTIAPTIEAIIGDAAQTIIDGVQP